MKHGVELIEKYFDLSDKQRSQFEKLEELYIYWNAQINVISRKDTESLFERHILHSLGINCIIEWKDGSSILDVGTGGGFPLIPLSILNPNCSFHGVDSIGKKIKVVNEIIASLELKNITAKQQRVEKEKERYDFVVSRAVTRLKPFVSWVHNNIKKQNSHTLKNGILYLKGGDLVEELAEVKRPIKTFNLADFFEEEFFETKKVVYVNLSK